MFQNIAVLIMMVFFYNFIPDRIFLYKKSAFRIIVGILFGVAAIMGILVSSTGEPSTGLGINSIIIPLAGFTGGIVSAVITTCLLVLTLFFIPGATLSPPDLLIIISTFIAGILVFFLKDRKIFRISSLGELALLSLLVSAITVGAFLLFPPPGVPSDLTFSLDMVEIFGLIFLGFLFLGAVILSIDKRKENEFELMSYKEHLEALVQERTFDLERANALQNATIDSTVDGIVVVDFEGLIRDFNTTADHILNISEQRKKSGEEVNLMVLIRNQITDKELLENPIIQSPPSIEQTMTTSLEFRSGRIFEVNITPYRLKDKILGRVMNFRDVTNKKHAEESLRNYNQKLLLLSGITRHDTLNQLTVLTGYLELSKMTETDQKKIEYIQKELVASGKIEELLRFTSDYQDLGQNEPVWQNPAVAFKKACASFSESGIIFSANIMDMEIYTDPLLDRVFYNLIDNSIRHGTHVTTISLSVKPLKNGLVILYEDNGSGVVPEEKKKIFTRGFGKHTGFGLFLIREILSITGIGIEETGTYGEGVKFEIQVPVGKFREKLNSNQNT
jgi:PAS domain S-box-containing protein